MADDSTSSVPRRSPRMVFGAEAVLTAVGIVGILALGLPVDVAQTSVTAAVGWAMVGTVVPLSLVPMSLRALDGALGIGWAVVVASGLFGLAHLVTPLYALGAALMGDVWGGLFIVTGGLAVPMVAHAAYDFGALILVTPFLEAL